MAGIQRHMEPILKQSAIAACIHPCKAELNARVFKNAQQMTAERTCTDGALPDNVVQLARIETCGPRPGVDLTAVGKGHLQPHSVGSFEFVSGTATVLVRSDR